MTKNTLKKIAIGAASFSLVALPYVAMAQNANFGLNPNVNPGLATGDVRSTIAGIIRAFMGLLGIVAVVIILLGGFKWMTAQGNEEKVEEAKKLIVQGVIGLIIITLAYAIAGFAINAIVNQSS